MTYFTAYLYCIFIFMFTYAAAVQIFGNIQYTYIPAPYENLYRTNVFRINLDLMKRIYTT